MTRNNIIIALALPAIFLLSCESIVTNVDLPQGEPNLVINAFLSPQDSRIVVTVSETAALFDTIDWNAEVPYIEDAAVFVSSGSTTKQLSYDMLRKQYYLNASELPIIAGNTYTVKVKTPDKREAEGSTTIPVTTSPNLILEDTTQIISDFGTQSIYRFRFTDPAGIRNYYRILATITWESLSFPGDTFVESLYMDSQSEFIDDINFDGSNYLLSFRGYDNSGYAVKRVRAYFLNTDVAYYYYHRSLENYNNSGGNPFAEPVVIYSNVPKGRGVVASFNQQIIDVSIP